jgi:hypothetical protein
MTLCEFCVLRQADGLCASGRTIPKKMRCADFTPGIERFCSTPADYAGPEQLKQMALFFGFAGKELKLVMAPGKTQREQDPGGEVGLLYGRSSKERSL